MTGAQAADLPVKAKPVQYVKICSLYGAGFYYIPGTDMCLKIGGWVRAEYGYGMNGSLGGPPVGGNVNNRSTNDSVMRARGYITADARNQTEYGTVRGYIAVGTSGSDRTGVVNETAATGQVFDANRAFIQFAGFTFGITQSFYDFYSFAATGYIPDFYSDTGDSGWKAFAYTAQFGNGFSATVSAEMRRTTQLVNEGVVLAPRGLVQGSRTVAPSRYAPAMAASECLTSSVTSVWIRLGVRRRSWAPCIRSTRCTIVAHYLKTASTLTRLTHMALRSAAASRY